MIFILALIVEVRDHTMQSQNKSEAPKSALEFA